MAAREEFIRNSDFPPTGTLVQRLRRFGDPKFDRGERYTTNVLFQGRAQLAKHVLVPSPRPLSSIPARAGRTYCSDDSDSDSDSDDSDEDENNPLQQAEFGYWLHRVIKTAIYGRVWSGVIVKRRHRDPLHPPNAPFVEWEVTDRKCAVKEMIMSKIQRDRGSAEDPYNEVAAMQLLQKHVRDHVRRKVESEGREMSEEEFSLRVSEGMFDLNVMVPIDVLFDHERLYSVMPFVDGGELFDVLDRRTKFTEDEARYVMNQILNGIETLQRAGVCHRDMSLENLMIDSQGKVLIIDYGMCFKIPYNHGDAQEIEDELIDFRQRQRYLVRRDRPCGKPYYISPEIRNNWLNFDGHAVDIWALGPILFLMVLGFPPFEQANSHDERFQLMTSGYFGHLARSWNLDLTPNLICLLGRMFHLRPEERLSLEQIRAHPWISQGESVQPR